MKKITMLMMPLLLTAAFSFPVTAQTENATGTVTVAEPQSPIELANPAHQEQDNIASAAETVSEPLPKPGAATVDESTAETASDTESTVASETLSASEDETEPVTEPEPDPEPEPEPTEPDPFASDPYAQSSLKDIEQHFAQSRELAVKSMEFGSRARAIIAGTSDNRNFRRHCEYLTRAANNNVYVTNVAMLVFPRLLEVSNLRCESSIKTLMNAFTGELIREPLARDIRLSEMRNLLDSQAELARLLRNLSNQITYFCLEAQLQSSRRHVQGRIPEFLRAANRNMINLITRQNANLEALLNQFDHHNQFCLVNIDYFFAVSDHAPGVMQGAQLGRLLRSCADFAVSLHNYREEFRIFAAQFEKLVEKRLNEVDTLVGNKTRYAARIAEFTNNYPERDLDDMREETFSAQQLLQQALELLDTIREQADKLSEGDISAAAHEEGEADVKAHEILKTSLNQHLDSTSWSLKEFLSPPEELAEPVLKEKLESEAIEEDLASEVIEEDLATESSMLETETSEKDLTTSTQEEPASDTPEESVPAGTATENETAETAPIEASDEP